MVLDSRRRRRGDQYPDDVDTLTLSPASATLTAPAAGDDGTPVEAPSATLRLTPMSTEPWYVGDTTGAAAMNTQYGVRTFVGCVRECHAYRRPSIAGAIDYDSAVSVVSSDAGITVSVHTQESAEAIQVATARVMVTGVVAGVSTFTLACDGVQQTYRVVVGTRKLRAGIAASEHADLPQLLPDDEDVEPCPATTTYITPADVTEFAAALDGIKPGDCVQLGDGVLMDADLDRRFDFVLDTSTGAKGWARLEWTGATATSVLGTRNAMPTVVSTTPHASAPQIRSSSVNKPSTFFGRNGNYVRVRGIHFSASDIELNQSTVWVGRYYRDDPINATGTVEADTAANETSHVQFFQTWFGGRPSAESTLYEGTTSAAGTDNVTDVDIPLAAGAPTDAQVTVGMLARIRRVGMVRPSETDYPSATTPYVSCASEDVSYGPATGQIFKVAAYSYNSGDTTATVTLEAYTDASRVWAADRPRVSQTEAGQVVEFLPAPGSGAYAKCLRSLTLNGAHHVVRACAFTGIVQTGANDSQAIIIYYGTGGWSISDNTFFCAASEIINTGGGGAANDMAIRDVLLKGNRFVASDVPMKMGGISNMKNLFEMKMGYRFLLEGNYFRGCMEGEVNQHGYAVILKTQYYGYATDTVNRTDCTTEHVTLRFNQIERTQGAISLLGWQANEEIYNDKGSNHITIHDNLMVRPVAEINGLSHPRAVTYYGITTDLTRRMEYVHTYHNTFVSDYSQGPTLGFSTYGSSTFYPVLKASFTDNIFVMGSHSGRALVIVDGSPSNGAAGDDTNIAGGLEGGEYTIKRNAIIDWPSVNAGQVVLDGANVRASGAAAPYASGTDGSDGQFVGDPLASAVITDAEVHASCTALRAVPSGATARPGADIPALAAAGITTTV